LDMRTEIRLSLLELVAADLITDRFPDAAIMRDWTERTEMQVRRQTEARAVDDPLMAATYQEVWDAFLGKVRAHFDMKHGSGPA